jgi:hypothetical protein
VVREITQRPHTACAPADTECALSIHRQHELVERPEIAPCQDSDDGDRGQKRDRSDSKGACVELGGIGGERCLRSGRLGGHRRQFKPLASAASSPESRTSCGLRSVSVDPVP